jgi:LacI family transcriptional regulator
LRDISKKTGISIATFSRVLNGSSSVSPNMKKKVLKALNEFDYHRSSMVDKRIKKLVGIIVPNLRGYHYPELTMGVEDALLKNDYEFFLATTKQKLSKEIDIISELYQRKADGIVICSSKKDEEEIRHLLNSSVPVVAVDRKDSEIKIDSVSIDNYSSAMIVANYLYKKGHRKILFSEGDNTVYSSVLRKAAFENFEKEHPDFHVHFEPGAFEPENGYAAVKAAVQKGVVFTAVFFLNDWMAFGGYRALHECGFKIPGDISVIAFDNAPLSKYLVPSLTTIHQPRFDMGFSAGQLLVNRIEGKEKSKVKRKILLNTYIVERESVKDIT